MPTSDIHRMIQAGKNLIYDAMSNIENLSGGVSEIDNIAFLTDQKGGVRTRFIRNRKIRGQNQL